MNASIKAVFLSYASQDANAARGIGQALRGAGIEVWLDQSELRGGDAWDAAIRKQIKACALFMPVISANTRARAEGYFRLEWKLAVDRSHLMAAERAFLLPVVIDGTDDADALVPDKFREVQWTRLPAGEVPATFVEQVSRLLSSDDHISPSAIRQQAGAAPRPDALRAGTRPAPAPAPGHRSAPRRSRQALLVMAAGVAIAVGYLAVDRFVLTKRSAVVEEAQTTPAGTAARAAISEKSVAVLPFVDMSEKKDQEYFADGLAEELMGMLTKVVELKVPARTSSFYFKGKQATIAEIAKALGVAHVLEGSVRKSGNTLRITTQLIRADNGYHVWSETYDRKLDDVFTVQDEIAAAVVKALKISLLQGGMPTAATTASQEAYALFLQARSLHYRGTHADNLKGIEYLEQALKLDPKFAPAWFGLADALIYDYVYFGGGTHAEVHARARPAAETALRLDPKLSDAHLAMARVLGELEWNWPAAHSELKRTLELEPNNVLALWVASGYALVGDRLDEALRLIEHGVARDAAGWGVYVGLGDVQIRRGRLAEAEAAYRKATELNATASGPHLWLGFVLLARGDPAAALAAIEKEPDDGYRQYGLALAFDALGRKSDADRALAVLEAKYADNLAGPIASVYACRKRLDQAFAWLDRAYKQRDGWLPLIKADPCVRSLEPDSRYKALLRRLKLPE
jgi:TolB-like protein/cytochrome c-type biogenesis protein CcmH/NrfG